MNLNKINKGSLVKALKLLAGEPTKDIEANEIAAWVMEHMVPGDQLTSDEVDSLVRGVCIQILRTDPKDLETSQAVTSLLGSQVKAGKLLRDMNSAAKAKEDQTAAVASLLSQTTPHDLMGILTDPGIDCDKLRETLIAYTDKKSGDVNVH